MPISHKIARFARKSPQQLVRDIIKFAKRSPHERAFIVRRYFGTLDWRVPHRGNDRTAYIIGLFGTGRGYVNELMLKNLGKRAKYFREMIRFHSGPDVFHLQRPCHNQARCSRSSIARGNQPYTRIGSIGICRFDFYQPSSPRFVADKLGLVAHIPSRQLPD